MVAFFLPKNCMGFDVLPAAALNAKERFLPWLHSFAGAQNREVCVSEMTPAKVQSFSAFQLEGLGIWVLHNNWSSVVGAIEAAPKAGFAYAVDTSWVQLEVPEFLQTWGPTVPAASDLNGELADGHWQNMTLSDRTYADKFKPTKPSHVLFNYWD